MVLNVLKSGKELKVRATMGMTMLKMTKVARYIFDAIQLMGVISLCELQINRNYQLTDNKIEPP